MNKVIIVILGLLVAGCGSGANDNIYLPPPTTTIVEVEVEGPVQTVYIPVNPYDIVIKKVSKVNSWSNITVYEVKVKIEGSITISKLELSISDGLVVDLYGSFPSYGDMKTIHNTNGGYSPNSVFTFTIQVKDNPTLSKDQIDLEVR